MKPFRKSIYLFLSLLSLMAYSATNFASTQPDELIKATSEKVLSALEQNKEKYAQQPEEIGRAHV